MTGMELLYLVASLGGLGIFIVFIRRASERSSLEGRPKAEAELPLPAPSAPEKMLETLPPDELPEDPTATDDAEDGERLRTGLSRTRGGFVAKLSKLFSKKSIDGDVLSEIEAVLFSADIGPKTANKLFESIKAQLTKDQLEDPALIWATLKKEALSIIDLDAPALNFGAHTPFVLLTIGVNGVGKTTTIGKVAAKLSREGKKVLLGAGDTFRAAAVEQLEIWGERANAPVIKSESGRDPSSVIFDAIQAGIKAEVDVVIADTAGRLHTKVDLMEELKKVRRVCDKALPGCPHETWLVLDATTGQNAIQQAQIFKEAMNITGIVLTKLDGTAKGGVILGICDELKVPVRFIGIGEQVDDLRPFHPQAFVEALFGDA